MSEWMNSRDNQALVTVSVLAEWKRKMLKVARGGLNLCLMKTILSILWKLSLMVKESKKIIEVEDDSNWD